MTTIQFSENGTTPFERLIGHNSDILHHWTELEISFFTQSKLPSELLEQVRRILAFQNECEYCMVKEGKPNFSAQDQKISLACGFAELFSKDHKSITQQHFDVLKEEFSEQEISELCSFIAFISANQKLGRIYNLSERDQTSAKYNLSELR